MRSIYFHVVGGAAGDMLLSALIGLGCPVTYLKKEFRKLAVPCSLIIKEDKSGHCLARKLLFRGKANLTYRGIVNVVKASKLSGHIKKQVLETYESIFNIERKIHAFKGNDFRFHHLGEIDAILEICGFYLALEYLRVEKTYVSSFPLSQPAPATLELLRGKNVIPCALGYESITPTASALLRDSIYLAAPLMFERYSIAQGNNGEGDYLVAYMIHANSQEQEMSCQQSELPHAPIAEDNECLQRDSIIKIETNIDDMNPQAFEPLFDTLYQRGAKEVYVEQVLMKKSRPAFVLHVLCDRCDFSSIRDAIFTNTTTFGIRYQEYARCKLKHRFIYKNTRFGRIRYRISQGVFKKEIPEYKDCLKAAKKFHIPILEIYKNIQ